MINLNPKSVIYSCPDEAILLLLFSLSVYVYDFKISSFPRSVKAGSTNGMEQRLNTFDLLLEVALEKKFYQANYASYWLVLGQAQSLSLGH
jgi:hypothetical protein